MSGVANYATDQIAAMTSARIAALSAADIASLAPDQVAAFTTTQLSQYFSPQQVAERSTAQFRGMTFEQQHRLGAQEITARRDDTPATTAPLQATQRNLSRNIARLIPSIDTYDKRNAAITHAKAALPGLMAASPSDTLAIATQVGSWAQLLGQFDSYGNPVGSRGMAAPDTLRVDRDPGAKTDALFSVPGTGPGNGKR